MRRWGVIAVPLAVVLSLGGLGLADTKVVEDPQEGIYTPIDAQYASHGHEVQAQHTNRGTLGGYALVHDITMYDEWTNDQLHDFELRMKSRQWRFSRRLFVERNEDGTLYGTIWVRDRLRGYARVYRPDNRTMRIMFPKTALGDDVRRYRWFAVMIGPWECPSEPDGPVCAPPPPERVPDSSMVVHRGVWRFNE